MSEMNDIIKSSLEGIKAFASVDTAIGNVINTPSGVTIIPISKVTVGFAGGGLDYNPKRSQSIPGFGSGSGTGVSVTPLAFLTVSPDSQVSLISMNESNDGIGRLADLIESSPDIIQKIKGILT